MSQTDILIALRIKGFAKSEILADCLDLETGEVETALSALEGDGLVAMTKIGPRLTKEGQLAADERSGDERLAVEPEGIETAYAAFNQVNAPFKALISDWQTRVVDGEQVPNDHTDAAYDAAIIDRLKEAHTGVLPICEQLTALAPRFRQYAKRFDRALAKASAGEHRFVAAPIIDSYHTVWFELHEDLIRLSGRTRAAEALAGKAV